MHVEIYIKIICSCLNTGNNMKDTEQGNMKPP
jgi:hypothetical protein